MSALRLASREDIRYLGPLTFHDKRFYQDVDLAFKQRVTAGDGYTVGRLLDSMIRGDDTLDNRLNVINRPTLILWGRDDKLIPLTFGERFHQEITNSRLQIIDNCAIVATCRRWSAPTNSSLLCFNFLTTRDERACPAYTGVELSAGR